jgi:ABC-type transport system involved in multi-copper enzyme maturation permease subunit
LPPVLTIARLTAREASRRRLLLAMGVLTLMVIAASWWGFGRIWTIRQGGQPISVLQVRSIAYGLTEMVCFMFSAILALSSVLVASSAISGEVESGQALAILSRPVRRSELLLGKWLGLAALIALYTVVTAWLEFFVIDNATGYYPPHPYDLMGYLAGVGIVLMTLTLLLSTRLTGMTGGVIGLALYFMTWVAGVVGSIGAAFGNETIQNVGSISRLVLPTDGLWRGVIYSLEPAAVLAGLRSLPPQAASNPFVAINPPPTAFLVWVPIWIVLVLALAIWSLRTREI